MAIFIHPTAEVSDEANVGDGTAIWNYAQIREGAVLGKDCVVSKGVYVDMNVSIGDGVKLQNNASIYHGARIDDWVFVGPHVCFTNDLRPRAVNPDGSKKDALDWTVTPTRVGKGAAIGANCTIRCGVTIGEWAMIGAGSVVTQDVPPYTLVLGNPAKKRGLVCPCGASVGNDRKCESCGFEIPELHKEERILSAQVR
jgi:acetyltransferase-like isoleucine patch superfamily enzyme